MENIIDTQCPWISEVEEPEKDRSTKKDSKETDRLTVRSSPPDQTFLFSYILATLC